MNKTGQKSFSHFALKLALPPLGTVTERNEYNVIMLTTFVFEHRIYQMRHFILLPVPRHFCCGSMFFDVLFVRIFNLI